MSTFRVETYYYQGNERQVRTVEVEADDMLIVGENEVNLSILAFRDKKGSLIAMFNNWDSAWLEGSLTHLQGSP